MLTSPTDKLIDSATQSIHSHATAQAQHANRMAKALLALSDDELTAWLQGHAADLETIFTRHATVGSTINTLLATTAAQLDAPLPELVDVRPVADKLADQRRVIDWQTLTISTLPPEPQPEPPTDV
jgi:ABC-type transporter Mla subunit MlaD